MNLQVDIVVMSGHPSQEEVNSCAADGIHIKTHVLPKKLFQIQISSVYFQMIL